MLLFGQRSHGDASLSVSVLLVFKVKIKFRGVIPCRLLMNSWNLLLSPSKLRWNNSYFSGFSS